MEQNLKEHIRTRRQSYELGELTEEQVEDDPFRQLERWLKEAVHAQVAEPNAMCLATVDEDGQPDARYVLLRGLDERGLVFYTSSESAKGIQLAHCNSAALVFWWGELQRQVRVRGHVEVLSDEEADAYFASRPRGHQLAAWVSAQSRVVPNRQWLEHRMSEVEQQYAGRDVPRPRYWWGYRVVPHSFEFWQGRRNRLHDRLRYVRQPEGGWQIERLAP